MQNWLWLDGRELCRVCLIFNLVPMTLAAVMPSQESPMLTLNKVVLLGTLPEDSKRVYSENGTPQCSFTLPMEEKGQEHIYRLYIPVDAFGDRAENVAEGISAGDMVLVDGKLR